MRWLLAPYLAAAWLNARWWTRKEPPACEVADRVWMGRLPSRVERRQLGIASMVNLTAELPSATEDAKCRSVPVLDLTIPTAAQFDRAVACIESLEPDRPTLVCCALGYSRSASAVAAWLVATGRASSVDAAIAILHGAGRRVVLSPAHRARLQNWAREREYA